MRHYALLGERPLHLCLHRKKFTLAYFYTRYSHLYTTYPHSYTHLWIGHYVIVPKRSGLQWYQRIGEFLDDNANRSHRTHCHTFYLEMWIFFRTFIGWVGGVRWTVTTQFAFLRDCITPWSSVRYACCILLGIICYIICIMLTRLYYSNKIKRLRVNRLALEDILSVK